MIPLGGKVNLKELGKKEYFKLGNRKRAYNGEADIR